MSSDNPERRHTVLGWVCIASGFGLMLIALDVIPTEESRADAPSWVIALCGVVLILCGCMVLFGRHSRLNDCLAALVCFSFATVGIWAAVLSPDEGFSNPVPFLSRETNVTISRWGFGIGAAMSFAIAAYAVRRALRRKE